MTRCVIAIWTIFAMACGGAPKPAADVKGGFVRVDADPAEYRAASRKFALAIGISEYDRDSGWRDLKYPVADAKAVARALSTDGGFEITDVLGGRVSAAEIVAAIDRLDRAASDPDDVALVYISGHGTLARGADGALARFLATSESRMADVEATSVSVDELTRRFDNFASRRKVLILATCHAGRGKSALPPTLESELSTYKSAFFPPPLESASRASFVIGASGWGEPAREDSALGHDIYTYFLLESIRRRYDPDRDGAVTLTEAHDYARRLTWQHTRGAQRPYLHSDILGGDPIVVAGRPTGEPLPLLLSFTPALDEFTVHIDGEIKGALPGGIAVDAGAHSVEIRRPDGGVVARRDVTLRPGERLIVDDLVRARAGRDWAATVSVGYQAFLDSRSRARLVEPLFMPRVAIVRDLFVGRLRLSATVAATPWQGHSTAVLDADDGDEIRVPYRLFELGVGLGAALEVVRTRRLSVWAGPVFDAIWFRRRLEVRGAPRDEAYFGVAPSVDVDARLSLTPDLFLTGGARLGYLGFQVDGALRHIGLADLRIGAGVPL